MYVRELQVRELRCLARARAEFRHPDRSHGGELPFPNANVLLGTNGGGKSTVLKAIALASISPAVAAGGGGFPVRNLVRRGARSACEIRIALHLHEEDMPGTEQPVTADPRLLLQIEHHDREERLIGYQLPTELYDSWSRPDRPSFFVAAYGPMRAAAEPGVPVPAATPDAAGQRLARIRNLLHEETPLVPLEAWLRDVDGARLEHLLEVVNDLLPSDTSFHGQQEGDHFLLEHRGVEVPFRALSDGLRSYLAWVCDLLYRLHTVTPEGRRLTDVPGVLLVDEIDQRLHPRWQQRVLPTVAGVFPRLQILASTHSPLVAGSLHHHNLFLLEPDRDAAGHGAQRIRTLEEEVFGRTADRILQGSFFDLESTRADAFRAHLRRLVAEARARGDERVAARFLRSLAGID